MAYPGFKLFALIVDLPQAGEVGLGLVLEEGVMQHLIVDVQLAHLGLHAVPLLLLQLLVLLLFLQGAGCTGGQDLHGVGQGAVVGAKLRCCNESSAR